MGQPNTLQLSLSCPRTWPSFSSWDGRRAGCSHLGRFLMMLQRWHREGVSCRRGSLTGFCYYGIRSSRPQGEPSYCFGYIPITGGPWSRPPAAHGHHRSFTSVRWVLCLSSGTSTMRSCGGGGDSLSLPKKARLVTWLGELTRICLWRICMCFTLSRIWWFTFKRKISLIADYPSSNICVCQRKASQGFDFS